MNNITASDQLSVLKAWLGSGSINLFGLPFAGKDTQAQKLAGLFNAPVIGGGDILRGNPNIPDRVRKIIDAGKLAPTEDYLRIVTPYLGQKRFIGKPLILSSVGRWHGEEPGVLRAAVMAGHTLKAVVFLDLDADTMRRRWRVSLGSDTRGQRADDAAEVLETRLEEFHSKTRPVLDFYRQMGLLLEIDGSPAPGVVTQAILDRLTEVAG